MGEVNKVEQKGGDEVQDDGDNSSSSSGSSSASDSDEDVPSKPEGVGPQAQQPVAAVDKLSIKTPIKSRTCAKMLVRGGLRCVCHFAIIADCPTRTGTPVK